MKEKREIDRTTRFLVTLTLFGGTWFVFRGIIEVWANTFSEIVYAKGIISHEHILWMSLLIVMVAITGSVLKYVYLEYNTYRHFAKSEQQLDSIKKADSSFDGIFTMIKISFVFIIILNFLTLFISEIKILTFLVLSIIGICAGILYKYTLKNKIKRFFIKTNIHKLYTKAKLSQLWFILYIFLIILVLSLALIMVSFDSNQEVEINIVDTNSVPLIITLNNYDNPTMEINIFRENNPNDNINLTVGENEFQRSLIEVYETNLTNENFLIKSSNNNKFPISQNKDIYQYNLELGEYLLEGKNVLEIFVFSEGNISKKTVHIITEICIEGDKVEIPQKSFKVNP
ncbi:hypothetical protein ACFSTA_19095 [Ornithinibacillus salinisoli]|uniref:Uncharacterized protein n=1 Tax=Ornithinibacillus salinisoli TaxID=1848459 RepID=A0ABW4W6K8_9BACI